MSILVRGEVLPMQLYMVFQYAFIYSLQM